MCGIFGYIGPKDVVKTTISGLKKLEYRGYDSAGIAGIKDGKIVYCKEAGKVAVLEKEVEAAKMSVDVGIAQTRWATHGQPSKINAHPHLDNNETIAVVHNGIIENYESLKKSLIAGGAKFLSQTDTEVIAHLVASFYEGDFLKAVQKAIPLLKGAFAIALIHRDFPDCIIAVAQQSPLIIGKGQGDAFVSSDANAFAAHTREVLYLADSEIAVIKTNEINVYDASMDAVVRETKILSNEIADATKSGYEHFTLKEIHEQPQTIRSALLSRTLEDYGTAFFEELSFDVDEFLSVQRILILACGTSWNAGYLSSYMFEDKARIPVQVEISSEFRYKNPIVPPGTLVIAISQSGETADTIAAVRELKAKGNRILAICNVHGSTLAREADACLFLKAGPEIGVCSTKAFTSQIVVLSLLCLMMARMRHMSKHEGQEFLEAIQKLPAQVQTVLDQSKHIEEVAKKYAHYQSFFFLGRSYMYPASLEGALKLKEISYINANGYPAGEIKHGPIALINEECPTVALCANRNTYEKLQSNLMEIKARKGPILAIAEAGEENIQNIADDVIWVPATIDELAGIPTTVVTQLLAYYIAKERGADIDQPRNLAKSVTVE
ncbi:MAG TPA: glutamine--fructose-6-phosphate transaminase (isomerizing) [Parachlamydiaceae bacterium]|nr:glutamine--fructose-6-phosphate transaminase (isomerizing) [Parachlamydiaceae bacterium]